MLWGAGPYLNLLFWLVFSDTALAEKGSTTLLLPDGGRSPGSPLGLLPYCWAEPGILAPTWSLLKCSVSGLITTGRWSKPGNSSFASSGTTPVWWGRVLHYCWGGIEVQGGHVVSTDTSGNWGDSLPAVRDESLLPTWPSSVLPRQG